MGASGTDADSEIIALAVEALFSLDIKKIRICIGHTGFLSSMLENSGLPQAARKKIIYYLIKRDFASLHSYIQALMLKEKDKASFLTLPELQGGKEVIEKAVELLPPREQDKFSREMLALWDNLYQRGISNYISLDFSFLRDLNYYTGIIFEIYSPHSGYPLGGGGRYDRLLSFFRGPLPAVGFALSVDQILSIWQQKGFIRSLYWIILLVSEAFSSGPGEGQEVRAKGTR